MSDTNNLRIYSSRLPAYLLQRALMHRGISLEGFAFQYPDAAPTPPSSPVVLFLQCPGLEALQQMGCDVRPLYHQGHPIRAIRVLDDQGRTLFEQEQWTTPELPGTMVLTEALRQYLEASVAQARSAEQAGTWCESSDGWTLRYPNSGMYERVVTGRLRDTQHALIMDHPRALVWTAQATEQLISCFAVLKVPHTEMAAHCAQIVDELWRRQARWFHERGDPLAEQWFPVESIGYRSCWGTEGLRWGRQVLRLHPAAGHWVSFWAIQANRLAEAFARQGGISPRLVQDVDQRNRRMFWLHLHTMNYYLRPNGFWKTLYRPAAWLLRHSRLLRRINTHRLAWL